MKKVITLAIVVVSLLSMGCNSLKRQINPNQQKIGVEGEDYTLSYHKLKDRGTGFFKHQCNLNMVTLSQVIVGIYGLMAFLYSDLSKIICVFLLIENTICG